MLYASRAVLACLSLCAAACIPSSAPPAGRQLVNDRISTPVGMVRPNGDGITRVLYTRPGAGAAGQGTPSVDLYVVSAGPTDAPPSGRLLAADLPSGFNLDCWPGPCSDARGRLFVDTDAGRVLGRDGLARIDPVTGDRLDFGAVSFHALSPSGQRLIVYPAPLDGTATVYEADDRVTLLSVSATAISSVFAGEDLYYADPQQGLMRLPAGGPAQLVAAGVTASRLQATTSGKLLFVLQRPAGLSILDGGTGNETPLPAGTMFNGFDLSPDGRWLVTTDATGSQITFTDWAAGIPDSFSATKPVTGLTWRPGHDEVWQANDQLPNPFVTIWKPGADPLVIPGFMLEVPDGAGQAPSFTRDGAYWFSAVDLYTAPRVEVAPADDPTQPARDLAPANDTVLQFWPLADGRLLTAAFASTSQRCDVRAVDPATGDAQMLGEQGVVMAVGQTRVLVNQHILYNQGDLTVFDLHSGRATVLAPEFAMGSQLAMTAFVEQVGTDAVAPGAQLAYQFQARFSSPYDGIWLATVP